MYFQLKKKENKYITYFNRILLPLPSPFSFLLDSFLPQASARMKLSYLKP